MELVKIHGRSTFSASWTVDGSFGIGGDSGAWVVSNDDGKVCGHVLASRKGRTYICPMDLLLEDIKATLGAESVALPAPEEQVSAEQAMEAAVRSLRIDEAHEAGGVTLRDKPVNEPRVIHSQIHRHFAMPSGAVEAAC